MANKDPGSPLPSVLEGECTADHIAQVFISCIRGGFLADRNNDIGRYGVSKGEALAYGEYGVPARLGGVLINGDRGSG